MSSDKGSLHEVIGDTGLFFDPYDFSSISRAINSISGDASLRKNLSERALARASTFTWERAARLAIGFLKALPIKGSKATEV